LSDPEGQQPLIEHLRVAFLGEGEEFFQILGTEAPRELALLLCRQTLVGRPQFFMMSAKGEIKIRGG